MSRIDKSKETESRLGAGGIGEWPLMGTGVFFESDGNVLKFIVIIVVQLYEYAKKMLDYIP